MAHPQSQIPRWISKFNKKFYEDLTRLESDLYTTPGAGTLQEAKSKIAALVLAFQTWKGLSRTSKFHELLGVSFGYKSVAELYGETATEKLKIVEASNIFTFGGLPKTLSTSPSDRWRSTLSGLMVVEFLNLDADIATMLNAFAVDVSNMESAKNSLVSEIQRLQTNNLIKNTDAKKVLEDRGWGVAFGELKFPGLNI